MQSYRCGLFLGGSLLAVALAAFLLGGSSGPPAVAQPPAAAGGAAAGGDQMTPLGLPNQTPRADNPHPPAREGVHGGGNDPPQAPGAGRPGTPPEGPPP